MPALELDLTSLESWIGSPAAIREAIFDGRLISPRFAEEDGGPAPSDLEITEMAGMAMEAVNAGRVIDFGLWTQEALMVASKRGGPLYTEGAIVQPFSDPWMFMHTFRGPDDELPQPHYCAYLVSPIDGVTGRLDIVELELVRINNIALLMVGDRVALLGSEQRDGRPGYHCLVVPSPWRSKVRELGDAPHDETEIQLAASCNVLDPLMTALLMLNTSGVTRSTMTVSPKLNRARAKNGKPPIPPYDCIDSSLYVTALTAKRSARGERGDGHHASPVPHIRRGHIREYQSGQRSFIRDTLVRVDAAQRAAFKAGRSHYEFRGDAP